MLAFRSVRFFLIALAGGAIAQDIYPVTAEGAADQLSPPISEGAGQNPAISVDPNTTPWPSDTHESTYPAPVPYSPDIADSSVPQPSIPEAEIPAADSALPEASILPANPDTNIISLGSPQLSTLSFEPSTILTSTTSTTITTTPISPTTSPSIIVHSTNLSILDADNPTLPVATAPVASGISWTARPTTLQTITTTTRPNLPLWTASGSAVAPPPVGQGDASADATQASDHGAQGDVKEAEEEGSKENFKPANHWVLPLNWSLSGNGKGKGQEKVA
jgi:hypothetical protein